MSFVLRILPAALLSVFGGTAAAPAASADWPTFQGSNSRAGVARGAPAFTGFRRRFSRPLDGRVYGQPLIYRGAIYVATENNSVYGFAPDGRQLFRRHFGAPVPGSDLPCGNIDPSGITGTPAIARDRLYAVAYLRSGHHHRLYGLSLPSGRVVTQRAVDPPNGLVEQQRGALLADHGRVYVPYGGLYGDCGSYHGYVIGVPTGRGGLRRYSNPSGEAGIWAPGGIAEERSGNLLVATGNGSSGGGFQYANSVLRLSASLRRTGFWAPADWSGLSGSDTDVGSISPLPLPAGRVFQSGKNGVGYILRRGLNGIGHEAFSSHICGQAFGAAAVTGSTVLVPCDDKLIALRMHGERFSVAWSADGGSGIPSVTGATVIAPLKDGSRIRALRVSNGHEVASTDLGASGTSFPGLAISANTLAAGSGRSLVVFGI
ncbi:MAG TPA: PQQ-binding-like beta-propeller repeat protein [Solirubrobacteraceae bacterium]|jgi:hypothetical protein|nr:PQQ-binding-like beta-propeller repeat protein [Solirubrobacteraceae bacterium]